MRCSLGSHEITGAPRYFADKRHVSFLKKIRKEFRPRDPVCANCFNSIVRVYEMKRASAIRKLKEHRSKAAKQCVSDPSISSTISTSSRTCNDSFDKMVFRTPRNLLLKSIVTETRVDTSENEISSEQSSRTSLILVTPSQSQELLGSNSSGEKRRTLSGSRNQPSPLYTQPSTNAAAALRRQQSDRENLLSESSSNVSQNVNDLWDDEASPAALNGTRLPHVQPILKRRKVVRVNKDVMAMYTSNIIGG